MKSCPCGSGKKYSSCCGLFIDENQLPATPEELMRSRFTAYAESNIDYIQRTMKGPAAVGFDADALLKRAKKIKWTRLDVIASRSDSPDKGFVEFRAYYSRKNTTYSLHEISEFHRENGRWYYVDGEYPDEV